MKLRRTSAFVVAGLIVSVSMTTMAGHGPESFRPYRRPVTTWIPPYAVSKSFKQIDRSLVSAGLTHLDLQFWEPTLAGDVRLVHEPEVTEEAIHKLRDWCHANGIRVMLCVFNGENKWDWPLAKAAFADHKDEFVKSLVSEMEREKLDGVDIDLEGPSQYEGDKPAFLAFMASLSKELHAKKRHLSVDSFCYKWNAPNQGWWPELFPLVDQLTTMGYELIGSTAPDWKSYAEQKKAAGKFANKLQLGITSERDAWLGSTAVENLKWIQDDGGAGIGIWDAQLNAKSWKGEEVWQSIKRIREGN